MTGEAARRVTMVLAGLLTPVVAWAASFFGGWAGAALGERLVPPERALWWLAAGAAAGAAVGLAAWVLLWRRLLRRPGETAAPAAPAGPAEPR